MINIFISILIISLALIAVEWTTLHFHISKIHSRKIVHVGTSFLIIGLSLLFGWEQFIYLGIIFFFVLLGLRLFHPLESLSDRHDESVGEIAFPLGVAVAAYFAPNETSFIITMLILGIADTFAFYIGSSIKSPKLFFNKTLAGSLSFLLVAFFLCSFIQNPLIACVTAICLTVIEALSTKGVDNFTIPAVGILLFSSFA